MKSEILKEINYLDMCFVETIKREQEKIDLQKSKFFDKIKDNNLSSNKLTDASY